MQHAGAQPVAERQRAADRFENTPADRPYSLLLASATASSSVPKVVIYATGPNTSSSNARMPGFTPASTVGL